MRHQVDELEQQVPNAGRSEFSDERTRSGSAHTHPDTPAVPLGSARGVTALQMSAGNQAVAQLMRSSSSVELQRCGPSGCGSAKHDEDTSEGFG
jgi:hypothetical protein